MRIYMALLLALTTVLLNVSAVHARGFGGGGGGGGFHGGGGGGGGFRMGSVYTPGWGNAGSGWGRGDERGWGNGGPEVQWGNRGWGNEPNHFVGNNPIALHTGEVATRTPELHIWNRANDLPTDGGFVSAAVRPVGRPGNHSTYSLTEASFRDQAALVREHFDNRGYFNRAWWARRSGWWYPGWGDGWAWDDTDWPNLAPFIGMNLAPEPVYYDYGQNITYQGNTIYYGTRPLERADRYYDQALSLAQRGASVSTKPSSVGWKPLGVFSLVQNGESASSKLFELAVNNRGQLRGNYYDTITDELRPITGAIDETNSRVAWKVSGNPTVVYDTGLGNLLKAQAPLLVHSGKSQTEQLMSVRVHQNRTN